MPYISKEDRGELDNNIDLLIPHIQNVGDLNYVITRIICNFDNFKSEPRYKKMNDIVGALECAKLEFYRRTSIYEQSKICQNGDVEDYKEFIDNIPT